MTSQRINLKAKSNGKMVNPHQATYELKQRVVVSLNKLADRDTYQIGVDELEKIAEGLNPEGISPFLSCITDTDSEQKSAVRKECIRVLGTLARLHGSLMSAHIGKMAASITRRLKDSDSAIRDACVETAGVLTMTVGRSCGSETGFVALVKPFFESLGEQNRCVQTGSALCLARVIDEAKEPPISLLAQMLTRVIKLLKNQHCMAKAAVVELIRSIVQAGGATTESALNLAVTSIAEGLKCNDWTTRKAASLALAEIAGSDEIALGLLKDSCIYSLESCRFDKVKPVRDAVVHALQCWKALPITDSVTPSESGSSSKDVLNRDYTDITCTIDGGWKHLSTKTSSVAALNGTSSTLTKKRTPLITRKNIPNQIYDFQRKDPKEWHAEISLPKSHNASFADKRHKEPQRSAIRKDNVSNESATKCWYESCAGDTLDDKTDSNMSDIISGSCETKLVTANNDYLDDGSSVNIISINSGPVTEEIDFEGFRTQECNSGDRNVTEEGTHGLYGCCLHATNDLAFIKNQLLDIKTEQSRLLNLLEVFMENTTTNMSTLHLKVNSLGGAVDEITQTVFQKGNNLNVAGLKFVKKSQCESPSRLSTSSTPRPSFDYKPLPTFSSNKMQLCKEKLLSRSQSHCSNKESLDLWQDPTINLAKNSSDLDTQKNMGRNQVKENENLFSVLTPNTFSKLRNCENEEGSRKIIKDRMCARDVESAYKEVLSSVNEVGLLELMNRTGPVLEKLSCEVATKVLCILTRKFLNYRLLPSMTPWLQQAVDLSQLQDPRQPYFSEKAQMELLYALKGLTDVEYIDRNDRIFIAQLLMKLSKVWGEASSRRIPLPNGILKQGKSAKV